MVRFRFKKGLAFFHKAITWTLQRREASGKLIFVSEGGATVALNDHQVFQHLEAHEWALDESSLGVVGQEIYFASPKDLRALSEEDRKKVERKVAYIRGAQALLADGTKSMTSSPNKLRNLIAAVAAEIADERPPSPSTLWRWWKSFRHTQCPTRLADKRRGGVGRQTPEQLRVLEDAVNEIYLTPQKKPIMDVVDAVSEKIDAINKGCAPEDRVTKPSQATIYRWMQTLYFEVVQASRSGRKATKKALRASGVGPKVDRILERIELDHTPVDLNLVCSETKMVLGRPYLTLAIDRKSRMIVGFYVSFHGPSASSILYCLRMAIRPKADILAKYKDIRNDWPVYGLFEILAVDNGMEEHAFAIEAVCVELGIELLYCEPGMPMQKGVIERVFRTLSSKLFHQLPGTVFSNPDERGDYPSEKLAVLDMDDFTHILVKWIVDVYHVTPHRGLNGKTPLQVWQEEAPRRNVDLPAYPAQLDTMVGIEATASAHHYGVQYERLFYNSGAITEMRCRAGGTPRVRFRAYEEDVGYIDVYDDKAEEFIRVPATDQDYANGLSRAAHLLINKEARRRFGDDPSKEQRRDVKREIAEIVAAAIRSKRARTRKGAAVLRQQDSEYALDARESKALGGALNAMDPNQHVEIPLHAVAPGVARRVFTASARRLGE